MTDDDKRIQETLNAARLSPDDSSREDLLQREFAGDEAMLNRVRELLKAHDATAGFSEPSSSVQTTTAIGPGTILAGRYKLIENIGEGGMGSVWIAQQLQPIKRRVAIKLVKAGMDSKQVLARFDAERQALAMMDHPNIAKVFDGGMTDAGRPFFVMEYVKGIPFTEYCDQARLSLKERLQLFIPVCHAVQHAHHKGIVHRDLKPSNILICLYDGNPVPKVIDFGLAKAMHQPLTEHSINTGHGMMIGTPLYMSPEQAELNNLDVDTRTDIYSLGVVLYELLVGTTPLERQDFQKAAHNEMMRLIKEVEPPRPSVRLSGSDRLPSIAAQRSIDPRELRRSLAGELDWIVMKSLEKERSRRYETANGLSRDIERFLNDEAVEACPPSRTYQLKKFVRKHKGKVVGTAAVLFALFLGLVGTTWQSYRAIRAEGTARASEQKAVESRDIATKERDEKEQQRLVAEAATLAEAKQRELAERQLIEGLLRPIGLDDEPTEAELRSFFDWSAISDSRLKVRVLEMAFEEAETAFRVARRAEQTVQACVCLSPKRRAKAIEIVSAKQRDMQAKPLIRAAACRLALELGSSELPAFEESIYYFGNGDISHELDNICSSLLSTQLVTRCGNAIISGLENDTLDESSACRCLQFLAPQLTTDQVSRSVKVVVGIIGSDSGTDAIACRLLAEFAPKLTEDQVANSVDALIAVLDRGVTNSETNYALETITAIAPKLNATQVEHCGDAIIAAFEKFESNYFLQNDVCTVFTALALQLPADKVTLAWDAQIKILVNRPSEASRIKVGEGLEALAPMLNSNQARQAWDLLIPILEKSHDPGQQLAAGKGIAALARKLSDDDVMRAWDSLLGAFSRSLFRVDSPADWYGIAAVGRQANAEQAKQIGDSLILVLQSSTNEDGLLIACKALAAFAPKLSSDQSVQAWNALVQLLEKRASTMLRMGYIAVDEGLRAIAGRLSDDQVTHSWKTLFAVFEKLCQHQRQNRYEYQIEVNAAGTGLKMLAARLSDGQAEDSADALFQIYQNPNVVHILARLTPQLSVNRRLTFADLLFERDSEKVCHEGWHDVCSIMTLLDKNRTAFLSTVNATKYLDLPSLRRSFYAADSVFYSFQRPESLGKLLAHPGCVGEPRELLLKRFEELVLHDGERVFLKLKFDDPGSLSSDLTQLNPPHHASFTASMTLRPGSKRTGPTLTLKRRTP